VCAEHLTKQFGEVSAVDDLSFALGRPTVTGFPGSNGADKRTTLRMLLHRVRPTPSRPANRRSRARLRRPAGRVKR
jgi:ABC-2 type transport system ATP-binding protein